MSNTDFVFRGNRIKISTRPPPPSPPPTRRIGNFKFQNKASTIFLYSKKDEQIMHMLSNIFNSEQDSNVNIIVVFDDLLFMFDRCNMVLTYDMLFETIDGMDVHDFLNEKDYEIMYKYGNVLNVEGEYAFYWNKQIREQLSLTIL